jgi:hypothetical protein
MRSREEVAYMLDWITSHPSSSGPVFQRGAVETLRWALGRQEAAPVTGRKVGYPVPAYIVSNEAYEATTAMYNGGIAKVGRLHQVFLEGVEHLAMWITGSDTGPTSANWPFPGEAPPTDPEGYPVETDSRVPR